MAMKRSSEEVGVFCHRYSFFDLWTRRIDAEKSRVKAETLRLVAL